MTSLLSHDIHFCVRRLPRELHDAMKLHGKRIIVAGGFLRSVITKEPVNDVDCFCPSKDVAETIGATLLKQGEKPIRTDNAFTILGRKIPIQFVHRWVFENPADVVPSFDFTIARAALWYEDGGWHSLCDERFYPDLASKRLVYCMPERNEDAGGSMLRVLKFYQRGYTMPLDSLGAVMGRMLRGVSEEALLERKGMADDLWEKQIGHVLTGLLREVDPMIDPDHIMHEPTIEESPLS